MKKETRKPNGYWTKEACYKAAQQCKTRSEFKFNFRGAYTVALNNGWLNDYTWFCNGRKIEGEKRTKWNYETCREAALQCKTKKEFSNRFGSAYNKSRLNGWLCDYTWFCNGRKIEGEKRTKWNYETCKAEAMKYKTRGEFKKMETNAYQVARKNGWLDEYMWLKVTYKPSGYWDNYDNCKLEALKYKKRCDFKKACSKGHQVALKNGWLDEWFGVVDRKQNGFWNNYDNCKLEANKYKTRWEFEKANPSAYMGSLNNGWLDEWFGEKVTSNFHDFIYVYEFPNNVVYVGRTINPKQREFEHIKNNDSVSKYVKKYNNGVTPKMQIIEEVVSVKIGVKREQYWIDWYRNNGYTLINKAKGGSVGALEKGKWNYNACKTEAKKYSSRHEFCIGSCSAYYSSLKNGWLNEFFDRKIKIQGYWNYERCLEEAKKYSSRGDFRKFCSGAYGASLKNKWLDNFEWFIVRKKSRNHWTKETCREAALQCKTKKEFSNRFSTAYHKSLDNGWLDDFFPKTKQAA